MSWLALSLIGIQVAAFVVAVGYAVFAVATAKPSRIVRVVKTY